MSTDGYSTSGPELAVTLPAPEGSLPEDRWVGTTLGKYHIVRRLGRGGMGAVYEAVDAVLQRSVAIKVLRDALAAQPEAVRKFLREARTAAKLNHPHVVAVYEAGEEKGLCYLVMEMMQGGSAHDRVRKWGPFGWAEATRVMADACRGLMAVHAAGLIHRDIKPSNIMRAHDGLVKLADFGLALTATGFADSLTHGGQVVGTPLYMSPEQCRGERIDSRSDIYALGATYYTLLTGKAPFERDSTAEIMAGHCSTLVPDPRTIVLQIPAICADLVRRMLAKNPADRPADAAALYFELEAVLAQASGPDGEPLQWADVGDQLPAATTWVEPAPPQRPTRTRLWLVALCLILMGAAFGVGRYYATRPQSQPAADSAPIVAQPPEKPLDGAAGTIHLRNTEFDAGGPVTSLAFDPRDSNQLSWATTRGSAKVHQVFFRRDTFAASPYSGAKVEQVLFSPTDRLWASVQNGRLHFHDTSGYERGLTGDEVSSVPAGPILAAAFHPREKIIALSYFVEATGKGGIVFRWLTTRTQDINKRTEDEQPPSCLAFSADGSILLQGKLNRLVQVWKVGLEPAKFSASRQLVATSGGAFEVGKGPITAIVALNGSLFAVAIGREVARVDVAAGKRVGTPIACEDDVTALAASPGGKHLACAAGPVVSLVDAMTGEIVQVWRDHKKPVKALAFDAKGEKLASGDDDGKIVIRPVK